MRQKIVAGNWKMYKTLEEAQALASEIVHEYPAKTQGRVQVILAPPAPYLNAVHHLVRHAPQFQIAAQNLSQHDFGAYTGEINAQMLRSLHCANAIIGHSERRQYYGETNAGCAAKITAAQAQGVRPLYCVGETLAEREAGQTEVVITRQLQEGLPQGVNWDLLVIAYEPVWAIGTGRVASPEQAQEVHAHIRAYLTQVAGAEVAARIPVLYGGSVKPDNAATLFAQPDIDGGLVGGASLKTADFIAIIQAADLG